jgi:hypothetical protein
MTIMEAKAIVAGPLRFGDDEQIRAKLFLDNVEIARARVTGCRSCKGQGLDCLGGYCGHCAAYFSDDVLHVIGVRVEDPDDPL